MSAPHTRRSSSHDAHNFDAVYRPIPQAPVASEPARPSLELDSSGEQVELADELVSSTLLEEDGRIRGIHFILGCTVLLPWNALITATPYFLSRLDGSPLKSTFSSYLSTTFMASGFGFLAHATATSKQSSNSRRVVLSMLWLAFLSATLLISTFFRLSPGLFFSFVLVNGILQAAAGSYLQTAVIAVASHFGHRTMQAVMFGQAAVGVVVSGVQVLSAAASTRGSPSPQSVMVADSRPEETSAAIFFGLSTLFLLTSAGIHAWMTQLPAYKAVLAQSFGTGRVGNLDENGMSASLERLLTEQHDHGNRKVNKKSRVLWLAKVNLPYNFAVAYVFAVTLSVFPPITVSIQSTNPSTHPLLFSAVHFLVYNIGDFVGRYLCSFPRFLNWSAHRLLIFSISRTLFIPLFLMCNIQWASTLVPSTPIINADVLYMFILLLFGVSNGYVSSMCMMSAPSVAHNPRLQGRTEDVDVAATVASFCLVGGLTVGSIASFAVRAAVCDCNPFSH